MENYKGKKVQHKKQFSCDICNNSFPTDSTLHAHKRLHANDNIHECDLCKKIFLNNCALTNHKRIHKGVKPFKCDLYGKIFIDSSHLINHKMIHAGEKPFRCYLCEKAFATRSELNRHKRIHLNESTKITGQYFASTSFVDCGEADGKLEIKEEEILDEDPFSVNMEAENVEEIIKQEIGEEMKDTDYLSFKENSYEDIDIVEHKIEFEL